MKAYIEMNLLIALGFLLFQSLKWILRKSPIGFSASFRLRLGQLILLSAVIFSTASTFIPKKDLFKPTAQMWSQTRGSGYSIKPIAATRPIQTSLAEAPEIGLSIQNGTLSLFTRLIALGVLLGALFLLKNLYSLYSAVTVLPIARRIGRVRIVVSQSIQVPFSTWLLGRAYVVIPESILIHSQEMSLAIRHEIQHHRQRDTLWVYVMEFLKILFFLNPAIYAWSRTISALQEFACDEFLIRIRKVSLQAYGSCLLEAAQTALKPRDQLVGTISMAAGFSGITLKRRIEMMFEYKNTASKRWLSTAVAAGTMGLMATVAFAQRSAIQDRKITYQEAEALARKANTDPKFPIEMNDSVFEALNNQITNESMRDSMKEALKRMDAYKEMIQEKITAFELVDELLAVPIVESAYQNYNNPNQRGAGLWGFIVSTGRKYGLHITQPNDPRSDERLVEHRETLAAMRYFTHLKRVLYRDWRLALRGYNEGESRVHNLIEKHGTRDPWALERIAPSSDRYLPKMIAAIIIMRNPSVLD